MGFKSEFIKNREKYRGFPHKKYEEYTKEELEFLPPVPDHLLNIDWNERGYDVPYIYWDGMCWSIMEE